MRSLFQRPEGLLLSLLLAFGPLAFGGIIQPWRQYLAICAMALGLLIVARGILERNLYHALPVALCWSAAVIAWGWLSAGFPRGVADRVSGWVLKLDPQPRLWPGTMDQASSVEAMLSVCAALFVFAAAAILARHRFWRLLLATSLMLGGLFVALLGLAQKLSGDLTGLWGGRTLPPTNFGPFWYHANAGAFLNLCWPITTWLFLRSLRRNQGHLVRAFLACALVVQGLAVLVNISKAAHFIAVLQLGMILLFLWLSASSETPFIPVQARTLALAIAVAGGILATAWLMWDGMSSTERWEKLWNEGLAEEGRIHAAKSAWVLAENGSWEGFGPGTFAWVFPIYGGRDPALLSGRWLHAHNDWLEYLAEWGWAGFAILLTGPFLLLRRCWKTLRKIPRITSEHAELGHTREVIAWMLPCLLGVALHALVDFPLQILGIQIYAAAIGGILLSLPSGRKLDRPPALPFVVERSGEWRDDFDDER